MVAYRTKVKPPSAVSATATVVGSVSIRFNAAASAGWPVDHYNLYKNNVLIQSPTAAGLQIDSDSIVSNVMYDYEVSAVNTRGNESVRVAAPPVTGSSGPPPVTVTDDQLNTWGYVVVTRAPYSAVGDGVTDDTAAIQAAVDAAYAAGKPVWFPSRTYLVSNTLRAYAWGPKQTGSGQTNTHQWFGATFPSRPIIKLAAGAAGFQNAAAPRPVVGFAKWRPTVGGNVTQAVPAGPVTNTPTTRDHIPSSPYIAPHSDWGQATSILFKSGFANIDIDTNQNAGADGLCFATAQGCYLLNVRVVATGSHYGIQGLPGRSAVAMNIEVQGGQVGVSTKAIYSSLGSTAGCLAAGLRCFSQTVANIEVGDFVPLCVIGFHFTRASGSAWQVDNSSQTATNGATLIDGIVETSGSGIAIDNTNSQSLYVRNVYVTGTANLVKSGASATITGTGTWKRLDEYSANAFSGTFVNPGTASDGSSALQHFAFQDGVSTRVQEHVVTRTNDAGAPPSDLIDRHIAEVPTVDQGTFIDITAAPYNAVAGTTNSMAAIQAAIDAAAVAGHNRVFVPRGTFRVGTTGVAGTINLGAHTKMWGCGLLMSIIRPRDQWVPADSTSPHIVTTASDAQGTAQLALLTIQMRMNTANNDIGRFSHLLWRAGRKSVTCAVDYDHDNIGGNVENHAWGRVVFTLNANGGGRHYMHYSDGDGNNGANFRAVVADGTTQPMAFYGFNCEAAASFGTSSLPQSAYPESYMEVNNAANIRVYSCKREGQSPTVTITDSTNVGVFSGGGMRDGEIGTTTTTSFVTRYHEILGNSTGILMANLLVQNFSNGTSTTVDYTLYDGVSSSGVLWPNGVALYKRGYASYDDSAMDFT